MIPAAVAESNWVTTYLLPSLPALVALTAAIFATYQARAARTSQGEMERLRILEQRVSGKKYEVYEPMLALYGDMLTPGHKPSREQEAKNVRKMSDFSTWIAIFGSDEAATAHRNLMQASFNDAPPQVFIRLYGDFLLAARRDMNDPQTGIDAEVLVGMRLKDLYTDQNVDWRALVRKPLSVVAADASWAIPWQDEVSSTADQAERRDAQ